jgi:hypothetical protein
VVSATDPHGRNLGFLDPEPLLFHSSSSTVCFMIEQYLNYCLSVYSLFSCICYMLLKSKHVLVTQDHLQGLVKGASQFIYINIKELKYVQEVSYNVLSLIC